ncbi:hypothetical protein H5410_060306 [Solanum commersonii]|uniref:Uncharacterized protein n=1 Tax=Solanum commersonii TaxID=4109 RepID=A0A9J5W5M4_SOLCO|nr:hypothetical protein H5410_060306 [Solanum commersonii]
MSLELGSDGFGVGVFGGFSELEALSLHGLCSGVEEEGERLGWSCLELGAACCLRLKPARWWWREWREEDENEWRFWVVSSGVCWPEKGGVMDVIVHLFGGHLVVAFCLKKKIMNGALGCRRLAGIRVDTWITMNMGLHRSLNVEVPPN